MDQVVTTAPDLAQTEGKATLLRLTAEQVGAMCDAGVFGGVHRRVELREGLLYRMSAQAVPHVTAKVALLFALRDALLAAGIPLSVVSEGSVRIDEHNLPEPDVIVWNPLRTRGFIPVERVQLLVEVCNTTHEDDLGTKPGLYARGGIPEYWIADLPARTLHQRWDPANGVYRQERKVAFGAPATAATLPNITIDTAPLLDTEPA